MPKFLYRQNCYGNFYYMVDLVKLWRFKDTEMGKGTVEEFVGNYEKFVEE